MRVILAIAALIVMAVIGFAAYAWEGALEPVEPPEREAFDAEQIKRGAELAAIGNCNVCHTRPGGEPFAGGLEIPTPFGTIHSTNITPHVETGIGSWSQEAFIRAMRRGVDREGRHLYPAFPYDHFTLVSDEDNRALYAYLMTRQPVEAETQANELVFPLAFRPLLAGWKLLFLDEGPMASISEQSEEWNRGRYLVEGLGHCGACHTPRNRLGAEREGDHFAGGDVEGWHAYAINASSPAPVPWDSDSLTAYLHSGWHEHHGASRGPMAPVTTNLGSVPEADVRAIATYVSALMGEPSPEQRERGEQVLARTEETAVSKPAQSGDDLVVPAVGAAGAAIFESACITCHDGSRPLPRGGLNFNLSTAINAEDPQNIINVTLYGLPAAPGEASPIMPGFAAVLDANQMTALLEHLRANFSDRPAWEGLREQVEATMSGDRELRIYSSDGVQSAPADPAGRTMPWP